MREYDWNGSTYLFNPEDVPAGAVEVKPVSVKVVEKPANKAVKPKVKSVDGATDR